MIGFIAECSYALMSGGRRISFESVDFVGDADARLKGRSFNSKCESALPLLLVLILSLDLKHKHRSARGYRSDN